MGGGKRRSKGCRRSKAQTERKPNPRGPGPACLFPSPASATRGAAATSAHCSSFFIKRNKQTYSTKHSAMKARNSFRYSGLIHRKPVGVKPAAESKVVIMVVMKQRSGPRKPATHVRTTISNTPATLSSIRHGLLKDKHRPGLRLAAACRASAILRRQKPLMVKRQRTCPTNSV
ncbi:60S ribosomal protein L28-like [Hippopotamus amphibius kiboko]|uniref:60S ribosomal protein L28-like n=1 Tax=Hippopotamus amphibius kiboko TaxID=575201 RepID=UPI002593FFE4|nr:60S ribosomal protein L28-like [Hippopotamus amphibius kiboko]